MFIRLKGNNLISNELIADNVVISLPKLFTSYLENMFLLVMENMIFRTALFARD